MDNQEEIEIYMGTFTKLGEGLNKLMAEQTAIEKLPRDQLNIRMAKMQQLTRNLLDHIALMQAQMTNMNNVLGH
jgi:hypothetical protein